MKTISDQISIPSLCRHLSEMAYTLVGKQCLYDGKVLGSIPGACNLKDPRQGEGHKGNFFCLFFCDFLCFDFVPFVGDPRERKGYAAIPAHFWACR